MPSQLPAIRAKWIGSAPTDSTSMPRSFWNVRNSNAPFIPAASRKPIEAVVAAAAVQERRVRRPEGVPMRPSSGQILTMPPSPSSRPPIAGRRISASRPATAIAVTITS